MAELPEGFLYRPDFLSGEEESALLRTFETLPFAAFEYLGYTAKRRVVVYGWDYDFSSRRTSTAAPIPEFLLPLRARTAALIGLAPEAFVEAVIHEYPPGAPIGWHRDVPQFDIVAGVSLASACRMRLRPYAATRRTAGESKPRRKPSETVSIVLEPRSLYVMSGPARWQWQHSIPPVEALRYSVTLRTLRRASPEAAQAKRSAAEER